MKPKGFTLIELMIAVAIIGALAAIAIPKFAGLVRRSQEAKTLGNLGALRSALSIYYGDMEGAYPTDANALVSKYIAAIPMKHTPPFHPEGNEVQSGDDAAMTASTGDWYFFNGRNDADYGSVVVNCVHHDLKGRIWSSL